MAKAKTRKVICAPNKGCSKKHKIHKDAIPIMNKLRSLEFVACINTPGFTPSNKKNGIDVIGFDDIKNSYIVKAYLKDYMQKFYVKIKDERKDNDEETIRNVFYE